MTVSAQVLINGVASGPLLPVLNGKVQTDVQNDWRRSCDVVVVDETNALVPPVAAQAGTLSPYGQEIILYRGVVGFPPVPLGVFRIYDTKIVDEPMGQTIEIMGYDRAWHVSNQQFTDVYVILAGTEINGAIRGLVDPRFSFPVTYNFPPSNATTPLLTYGLDSGDDPWKIGSGLAYTQGNQLFFDQLGICTQIPWPDPTQLAPVWSLIEGEDSVVIELDRELTAQNLPNHVIALAEGSGITVPMRADAAITDSSNPLNISGPYGDVPIFVRTNIATDQQTLQQMANATLLTYVGAQEVVTVTCLPNPALDVNDVITIHRERSNTIGNYIIDSITCPLEPETAMQLTCRLAVNGLSELNNAIQAAGQGG